jgi:HEAT repeat protein
MLRSEYESVRAAGGRLGAFAGLEFNLEVLLAQAVESRDVATKRGAAKVCAEMIARTSDEKSAHEALLRLFDDTDKTVRTEAASVAMALRSENLAPHIPLLRSLISSPAFPAALAQLLITLETTSSRIEELALLSAERFIVTQRDEMSNIETGAAADSRHIGELLLRTYSQSGDSVIRSRTLDLLDQLLQLEAYGIADLIEAAER